MKDIDISDHFSELNRAVFEDTSEYAKYFDFLRNSFGNLIHSFNSRTTEDLVEINVMHAFIQKFLNTIEALSMRYRNEKEHFPKIDLTESSFPNHLEIKKLIADLKAAPELLGQLPSMKALKQSTLDYMFEKQAIPDVLLDKMYRRTFLEMLDEQKLFLEYSPGDFVKIPSETKKDRHFLYSWGSYDATHNRPFVYLLIFDLDKTRDANDPKLQALFKDLIKGVTQNTAPLRVMAHEIDEMSEFVKPKILKRIDLGPIYSKYSMDEAPLSKIVQQKFNSDEAYAFLFTTEVIFSIGEKKAKGFLSNGQIRQVFFIDESNKETMERHVSKVLKYMMAPHEVVQYLNANEAEMLKEFSTDAIAV